MKKIIKIKLLALFLITPLLSGMNNSSFLLEKKEHFAKKFAQELLNKTTFQTQLFDKTANFTQKNSIIADNQTFSYTLYGSTNALKEKNYKLFLYKQEQKEIIGCLYFYTHKDNNGCLEIYGKTLGVTKNYRGTGLAKGILLWGIATFVALAKNSNGAVVELEAKPIYFPGDTKEDLIPQNKLVEYYEKVGFKRTIKKIGFMSMYINKNGQII